MDTLFGEVIFAAACLLAFFLLKWFDKRLMVGFGLLFVAYLVADDLATGLPNLLPAMRFTHGTWNWTGKIYSLLLSAIVVVAFRLAMATTGLTLAQKNLKSSLTVLVLLTVASFSLGLFFKPSTSGTEEIAFQALMPGLAEEISYRGIAPALLLGLIRFKPAPDGMPWIVIFIQAIAFGLWHGLSYSNGQVSFDLLSTLVPAIGGVAYGWLRFNSGSVLLPIIAHNLGNSVFNLAGAV